MSFCYCYQVIRYNNNNYHQSSVKKRLIRRGLWPREFLKDYKGYLVVDDYAGYNNIPNVVLQKCFVHARRKFSDIYKANKDSMVLYIINLIDKIFEAERSFKTNKLSANQIKENRNSKEYLS